MPFVNTNNLTKFEFSRPTVSKYILKNTADDVIDDVINTKNAIMVRVYVGKIW